MTDSQILSPKLGDCFSLKVLIKNKSKVRHSGIVYRTVRTLMHPKN